MALALTIPNFRKAILASAALGGLVLTGLVAAPAPAEARSHWHVGVGVGVPVYPSYGYGGYGGYGYNPGYYYAPPPVVYRPPAAYYDPVYGPTPTSYYRNGNYRNNGPLVADPDSPIYQDSNGQYCREYRAAGSGSYGTACLESDGVWRVR